MQYLIKYSPEMITKSRIVRKRFCKQLRKNLSRILREQLGLVDRAHKHDQAGCIDVQANWDFVRLHIPEIHEQQLPAIEDVLLTTPGVWSFNRVLVRPLGSFDDILTLVKSVYAERIEGKSFAVRCRRVGKHEFTSMDMERYLGAGLLEQTGAREVNLKAPEVVVSVSVRHAEVFIVDLAMQGLGGFPLGTQDAVLSLISGGFDSAVSSFMTMKRGMRSHFLFFNLGGHEHELAVKELSYYLWNKFGSSHHVYFITVPFEAVVGEILEKVDNPQMGVVLKRMMIRAAAQVAESLELEALVTGESVAQVSSQTLRNLAVIDDISPMLVLRPLIMSDKQDIVDISRKIGTEQFSANIPEYCGVISVSPTTRARKHRIEKEESRFDMSVLDRALAERVMLDIDKLHNVQRPDEPAVRCVQQPDEQAIIIDIRHPDEEERAPLTAAPGNEILHIPFYKLSAQMAVLDKNQQYLLYCGKGVMSRLHASHLQHEGWRNIAVYTP